jgi:ADP-ribose pyrophosphatase
VVEHPGAVAIVAWDGERLAMVRQWRHPAERELLEIPAGTIDPGETPLVTARRELTEETGLSADRWDEGPSFFTAPGFCTERLTVYLATGLHAGKATGAADEIIEVERLTLEEALTAVDDGSVADAKSLAAILWLARRLAR